VKRVPAAVPLAALAFLAAVACQDFNSLYSRFCAQTGRCDAGTSDAATDAGSLDGGASDAGSADAGAPDAGIPFPWVLCVGANQSFCWENPLPQGNDLTGVYVDNANDVWAVGSHGTILRWDGGSWAQLFPVDVDGGPLVKQYVAVHGSSADDVWVVGQSPHLHFGGGAPTLVPYYVLTDIWVSAPGIAWGTMATNPPNSAGVAFSDGGAWSQAFDTGATQLTGIKGWDGGNIWAVNSAGAAAHWDGASWTALTLDAGASRVAVTSDADIWLVSSLGLSRGTVQPSGPPTLSQELLANCTDAWGTDPGNLWATCSDAGVSPGIYRRSADAGWSAEGPVNIFWRLHGTDPGNVWAVGPGGAIASRSSSGWKLRSSGRTFVVNAVAGCAVPSGADVWAGGEGGVALRRGPTGWNSVSVGTGNESITALWENDPTDIWFLGSGPSAYRLDSTSDAGSASDPPSATAGVLTAVWSSSANDVWIGDLCGRVWHRTTARGWSLSLAGCDAGVNVSADAGFGIASIRGSGPADVWAAAPTKLSHFDGGSWASVPLGSLAVNDLWVNGTDIWIVATDLFDGGASLWNADAGTLTAVTPLPAAGKVWSSGPQDAWVLPPAGGVFHWTDGGLQVLDLGTGRPMTGLWGTGPDLFLVGAEGAILHTPTR